MPALRRLAVALSFLCIAAPAAWAQEPDEDDVAPTIGEPTPEEPEEKPDEPTPEEPEEKPDEPTPEPDEPTSDEPTPDEKPDEPTPEAKPDGAEPALGDGNNDGDLTDEGEFLDVTGEPPAGDEPDDDESAPPQGDKTLDELMPSDAELVTPDDEDGDGTVDPEEQPIPFDVPDGLAGADYIAMLKSMLETVRPPLLDKLLHKDQAKQDKAMNLIIMIMLGLTAAGLLFLLLPLVLKKRYPGRERLLWRGAVLGAVTWIMTMLVFTGAMFLLRTAKNATAHMTSPKLVVTNAAFDAAPDVIDFVNEDAPVLFEAPIAQLAAGNGDGVVEALLDNVAQFRDDLSMFAALSDFFKSLGWLFGSLGTILVIIAVLMFMLSQKQVLADILRLPGRAAAGDTASFGAVIAEMQRRSFREVVALACTIGFLIVAAVVASVLLGLAVGPAVAALFDVIVLNVYYILGAAGASRTVVWVSLFGVGVFLALVLLFIILANAFFLGKAQKVWQQKFRHQLPASTYKKFWLWGPLSWLWVQVLPIIFIIISGILIDGIVAPKRGDDISWETLLLTGPLVLIIGLPIFMWLAQGFRAMKFLRKFDHLSNSPEAKPVNTGA